MTDIFRRCIAIDPGKTTGVLVVSYNPVDFSCIVAYQVGWQDRLGELGHLITDFDPYFIVMEAFTLYRKSARSQVNSEFEAVQVIGNVQALAWMHLPLIVPIIMEPAHVKMGVRILKEHEAVMANWDFSEHVKDAYKLFRYWWLTQQKDQVWRELK